MMNKNISTDRRRSAKRLFTFTLLFSIIAATFVPRAAAAGPAEIAWPVSTNKPVITVQANGVVDASDKLTGFVELALLVRTARYYSGTTEITKEVYDADPTAYTVRRHAFTGASIALEYDTEIFTPVDWRVGYADWVDGAVDVTALTVGKSVSIETAKPTNMVTGSAEIDQYSSANKTAVLSLFANAVAPVQFDNDTAVVMVRFAYDLDDDAVAEKMRAPASGAPTLLVPQFAKNAAAALWLASNSKAAFSPAAQTALYAGSLSGDDMTGTRFYTYQGQPATSGTTKAPDGTTIDFPYTDGEVVLTKDSGNVYSYLKNILVLNEDIRFTHINDISYLSGGMNLDDVVTILFYDWDDALLGTLNVPRGDARKAVNEYVENNFIHPDLRAGTNPGPEYRDNGSTQGLDRQYTYRGDFDFTGPKASDTLTGSAANTALDGEEYPLTNKLDYVLYKRATTLLAEEEIEPGSGLYNRYWTIDSIASDETGYPYVYGWAVVQDVKNLNATWTTFNVAELAGISPKSAAADPKILSGIPLGDPNVYHLVTSDAEANGCLRFADFSDLSKEAWAENFIAVKAIYEDGQALLPDGQYTMTKQPSYMQYNLSSSTEGGAYSIRFDFSRLILQPDGIHGVGRIREAAVRGELWGDAMSAGVWGSEITSYYQKVDVANKETVEIDLVLSGAVHKAEYYLVDTYGRNFVSGTQRTLIVNSQPVQLLRNFTYQPIAVEKAYADRFGSVGFVFTATLNSVLKEATDYTNDSTAPDFFNHMSTNTAIDLNLRGTDEKELTSTTYNTYGIRQLILNAISAALSDGYVDEDGTAVLSYHQLQHFISTSLSGSPTLLDFSAAEALPIKWCRQHAECIASGSGAPETWGELLDALDTYNIALPGDPGNAGLDALSASMIGGSPFYLRRDDSGAEFANPAAFIASFATMKNDPNYAAYRATLSWEQAQYYLINGNLPTIGAAAAVSNEKYWWKDGDAQVSGVDLSSRLASLLAAAKNNVNDTALRLAWNSRFVEKHLWLRSDIDGTPYPDFTAFKAAIQSVANAALPPGVSAPAWAYIQYYLIHGSYMLPLSEMENEDKSAYFWFADGGKVEDIETLLQAAVDAVGGRAAMLNTLTKTSLYDIADLCFAANFAGEKFDDIDELKTIVQAMVAEAGYATLGAGFNRWNALQYYIIHGVLPTNIVAMDSEVVGYYWWKYGPDPIPVEFPSIPANPTTAQINSLVTKFVEAAYRSYYNGNTRAWLNLTPDIVKAARMVEGPIGAIAFTAMDFYEDGIELLAFQGLMENLVANAVEDALGAPWTTPTPVPTPPIPSLNWYQAQHGLLNSGAYEAPGSVPGSSVYWWRDLDTDPNSGPDPLEEFLKLMYQYANDQSTANAALIDAAVETIFGPAQLNFRWKDGTSLRDFTNSGGWATTKTRMKNLAKAIFSKRLDLSANYYDDVNQTFKLTWYQIQYYCHGLTNILAGGTCTDPATAKNYYINTLLPLNGGEDWAAELGYSDILPLLAPIDVMTAGLKLPNEDAVLGRETNESVDAQTGAVMITETVTRMENGVLVIETTAVNTVPADGRTIITTTVTTVKIFPDGAIETSSNTEIATQPAPPPKSSDDPDKIPQREGEKPETPPPEQPEPEPQSPANAIDGDIELTAASVAVKSLAFTEFQLKAFGKMIKPDAPWRIHSGTPLARHPIFALRPFVPQLFKRIT